MTIFHWLLLLLVAFISFAPLTRLKYFDIVEKYRYFKYISILLFAWTLVTILRYVTNDGYLLYYLSLSIYPLIWMSVGLLFISFCKYLHVPVKRMKSAMWLIGSFFLIEVVIVATNSIHEWFLVLQPSMSLVYTDFSFVVHGPFFFVHTAVSYALLIVVVGLIFRHFYKNLMLDQDLLPFTISIIGILVGVTFNIIHIFIYSFKVDPTYIAFVLITTTLYAALYIRDLKLVIEFGRNKFILDNLREMYLIVNHRDHVVDASEELKKTFGIVIEEDMTVQALMDQMRQKAIIYSDPAKLNNAFDKNKRYLHMLKKSIFIPFFKQTGQFYLFYDETENQQYIHDIDYVKSHDLMTGLYNRNHFEEMKVDIDANKDEFAIIMFDLDGLKLYNDYLGHSAGDNLLIRFSNFLKDVGQRYQMIPIRMGGDEFLLVALNDATGHIEEALQEIKKMADEKQSLDKIYFSFGTSEKKSVDDYFERAITRSDEAMYKMKTERLDIKEELKASLMKQKK